jgi:hypothetical protein
MASLAQFFQSQLMQESLQDVMQLSENATQNLTGLIRRTEVEPFAKGGFANVWKGEWTPNKSRKAPIVVDTPCW